jgi:uncharacterized membrane protein
MQKDVHTSDKGVKQRFMKPVLIAFMASVAILSSSAADVDVSKLPPVAAKKDVTFEKDIKPVFEKSCFKCHGAEKQKAKLRVDTREATLKGSENGEVVVVGKSEKSSLVHSVAGLIEDGLMPPEDKGDPLTKEQIGILRAWIDQGAK